MAVVFWERGRHGAGVKDRELPPTRARRKAGFDYGLYDMTWTNRFRWVSAEAAANNEADHGGGSLLSEEP